ncbi:MAG: hypothetical protein CBC28_08245 [Flavobacteriaceae bacterium TMED68]|nr:MAG: hypothetical protein CBC28_08245 [Flavobacteriaceae bacterium TMED68]|tara:strand:- start:4692 stop:5378 length:687 start_codon:yes stop_codon:yes gene_type:complete
MKKILFIICVLSLSISFSQNTFRLWHFNAKPGTETAIGNLLTKHNENAEFKSGGVQIERISYGDNQWTHRVVAFGEVGKIGRTDLKDFQQDLFLEQIDNFVEDWGPSYAGRFLSYVGGQPKDFPFLQIYEITPDDPNEFKKAHDKFISKASNVIGDRPVAFGTYDIGSPNEATHWVVIGSSGFSDLIDQKQKWEDNFSKEAEEWAKTNGGVEFKSNFSVQVLAAFGSL